MKEVEFRSWLVAQGHQPQTVTSQVNRAKRIDQAYGDLDVHFAKDGLAELTRSLEYSSADKRAGKPNPAAFAIDGDLYTNLASYRQTLGHYARFSGGQPSALQLNPLALDGLKARFLALSPDFESGGAFPGTSKYHGEEDAYKRALVATVQAELARDPPSTDEALGAVILDALGKSNLLGHWKTRRHLEGIRAAHPGVFEQAAGVLARSTAAPPEAIEPFLKVVWPLLLEGSENSRPFGDTRIYATAIQALARPEAAISVIYERFHNFGVAVLGRSLFGNDVLTAAEYAVIQDAAAAVFTVMDEEWGWRPRDLWDVQGFIYTTCEQKLQGEQMGPAIDKPSVEKAMNECDALGDAKFVAKYGLTLQNIRYRVVRGTKQYPSKAIANAAYTLLHGEDGPYGGTQARKALLALGYQVTDSAGDAQEDERTPTELRQSVVEPVNLILYGPPGTGKTYATAAHAVRLCLNLGDDDALLQDDARAELMGEYRRLVDARRIQFVTFHQSYSYEEFVEGLRPDTGGDESAPEAGAGFRLIAKRGVFREISALAEQARRTAGQSRTIDVGTRQVFKMSLGRAGVEDHIFDAAIEGGYIALGWGGEEDWSDPRYDGDKGYAAIKARWNEIEPGTTGASGHISQLWRFRSSMRVGDLVVVSNGNSEFRAVGEITGPYRFERSEGDDFHHRRDVRWLLVPSEPLPADTIYAKPFTMRSCYLLREDALKREALQHQLSGSNQPGGVPDPYVLVIDEINRANISKVFGELITLIEPDKRIGLPGEIKVRLPYSRDPFGVPPNLHIVGTMNTADRSIALLDTALRRRFDFVELMPDPDRLPETLDGVPLRAMLRTINERIEYLFDREHQIGHGFFMSCLSKDSVDRVMRRKVLPLLQEYFFEDWTKVATVLGDADAPAGQGKFVAWDHLKPPSGTDEADDDDGGHRRWSIRPKFDDDAYERFGA